MYPTVSTYNSAQKCAQVMCHILSGEMKLQYPQKFLLTEHGQYTWLLAVMDDLNLGGSMTKYVHDSTLHRLSTALDGLPVFLSNHSGLRYAVLLSDKPRLPKAVDYPSSINELDVFPIGAGLTGPIHAHAKQIVNMIVVGAQDSGKSMVLRALAHTARLHGSDLYLADPVQHTFNPDVWGKVAAVAYKPSQVLKMLERINDEINNRSVLFRNAAERGIPPEDLEKYNALTGQNLPRIWMIMDEANTFLALKSVQERIADPARIGRKFGVHIVLAGHDWHEYTVNRGLTSFFETRLCLRTSNDTTGRIVLDDPTRGKRTMSFRQPGRGILRLRGQYQDVQLYNVLPERERDWFAQVQPSDERVRWVADQAEAMTEASVIEPTVGSEYSDEITRLAESIRDKWSPDLSATTTATKLLKLPQYGGSYRTKADKIIEYLTSTTTTTGENSPKTPVLDGFSG